MAVTWTCPSCGQEWPEKPLVDGTIGCPACGNVAAADLRARLSAAEQERDGMEARYLKEREDFYQCRGQLASARQRGDNYAAAGIEVLNRAEAAEARAEARPEETSSESLARLSAAEQERDEAWDSFANAERTVSMWMARAEAAEQALQQMEAALRGLMAALAVDAEGNLTGDFGQWSDAWLVAGAALAGREEGRRAAEARAEAAEQALLAIAEFYDNGERRVVVSEMKALARAALGREETT